MRNPASASQLLCQPQSQNGIRISFTCFLWGLDVIALMWQVFVNYKLCFLNKVTISLLRCLPKFPGGRTSVYKCLTVILITRIAFSGGQHLLNCAARKWLDYCWQRAVGLQVHWRVWLGAQRSLMVRTQGCSRALAEVRATAFMRKRPAKFQEES